jgi:microcystin-dependent protein
MADPLAFDVRNADDKTSAWISSDPAKNVLTLTVTNRTPSGLSLTPGPPAAEPPPASGPTSLYVSFGDLVPIDQIAQIKVAAAGWQSWYFSDPAPVVALTPVNSVVLGSASNVSFIISNFTVAGPPRPSALTVDYYGMGELEATSGGAPVLVANPPTGHKQLDRSGFQMVSNSTVFITVNAQSPIENTLVFSISNPSPTDPLVAKDAPPGPNPPVFLLSFVSGEAPGYGALSTLEHVRNIRVGVAQIYRDKWSVDQPDESDPVPRWKLHPLAQEILGTGAAASVEFRITGLVTTLKPGVTHIYLQYSGIPGYDDGYVTFQIEKQMPSPGILQFLSTTPATIRHGDAVFLAWQSFDAASLKLSFKVDNAPKELDAPDDIPFSGSYKVDPPPQHDTTYTLEVFDYNDVKVQKQVAIGVIEPPPHITSFSATPSRANLQDLDDARGRITLRWTLENRENAQQLTLISENAQGREVDDVLDLLVTSREAHVYRSGGVTFRLRVKSRVSGDVDEKKIVVETWEDSFTMVEVPVGTIVPFAGQPRRTAELQSKGWLKCDGGSVSRLDYPELYVVIGTQYGGDGNPDFALPDLRGMMLRGADEAAGRDSGGAGRRKQGTNQIVGDAPGSWQGDQGLATAFAITDSETHSMNVSVYYVIASGATNKPGPPTPPPYQPRPMIAATMLQDGTILGVGTDHQLYTRPNLFGPWTALASGAAMLGVSQFSDGAILGCGTDNLLYTRPNLTQGWSQLPGSGAVKAITVLLDGSIVGCGMDNYCYLRTSLTAGWQQIAGSNAVWAVMRRPDGKLVGIGDGNRMWVRPGVQGAWTGPIEGSGQVMGLAQLAYGVILGIGTDNQLYTRSSLTTPWVGVS